MESRRASVKEFLDEFGNGSTRGPVLREGSHLLLRWDLAGDEEPEKSLRQGLRATGCFGEEFLTLGNGFATEANALLYATSEVEDCDTGSETDQRRAQSHPR